MRRGPEDEERKRLLEKLKYTYPPDDKDTHLKRKPVDKPMSYGEWMAIRDALDSEEDMD